MNEYLIYVLPFLSLALTGYLVTYTKTKGKNQADKEDLRQLTTIVEDVKRQNSQEIELLKSNLNIQSNKKVSLFSDEKAAIVEFISLTNAWIWDITAIHLNEYFHGNYNDLSDRLTTMRKNFYNVNVSFGKISILVKDENLLSMGMDVKKMCLQFHHMKETYILNLLRGLKEEKVYVDKFIEEKKTNFDEFTTTRITAITENRKKIVKEVLEKQIETWGTSYKSLFEFNQAAKKYLNS